MRKASRKLAVWAIVLCMLFSLTGASLAQGAYKTDITWPDMFGDQVGTVTIDPQAGSWALTFTNLYGTYDISGVFSAEDGTIECTEDAGMGAFLPLDAIFAAIQEQIDHLPAATDETPAAAEEASDEEASVSDETPAVDEEASVVPVEAEAVSDETPDAVPAAQSVSSADITWPDMFGDQEGTLTLDSQAQTWSLAFENLYGTYQISGTFSAQDGTAACTDDAGMGAFLPLDAILAAVGEQVTLLSEGKLSAAAEPETVVMVEQTVVAAPDFKSFENIVTWGVLDFPTVFERIPASFSTYHTSHKGTQMVIHYTTDVYEDGVTYEKFARVYLPYGYDPEDTQTQYNVLYLQHGNNCSPANFFDLSTSLGDFATILDNLFDPEHGVMDPFILVCPTYYLGIEEDTLLVPDDFPAGDGRYDGIPGNYDREVVENLIPAVESQLNVYCKDFTAEGIKATRDHRAWAGYSRGSVCTWYMFHNDFEYFRYWMPTSAQCIPESIELTDISDDVWSDEAAFAYIKAAIDAHPDLPFFILAQSGNATDAVLMRTQMSYFADQTGTFSYGTNPAKNNFYYTCADFFHIQQAFVYYLYTGHDILFK